MPDEYRTLASGARVVMASEPRLGSTRNEDLIGVYASTVWVLDGATLPASLPTCCDRDACWYVHRLSRALTEQLVIDEFSRPLQEILASAIADVAAQHEQGCARAGQVPGPSSTVVIARVGPDQLDYLVLGDSTLLLQQNGSVRRISDERLQGVASQEREEVRARLASGCGFDDPELHWWRERLVLVERQFRNTDAGYWIAEHSRDAAQHAYVGSIEFRSRGCQAQSACLLTDGLARLRSILNVQGNWEGLMEALLRQGPTQCIALVRQAEVDDPLGKHWNRTKVTDDASAALIVQNNRAARG